MRQIEERRGLFSRLRKVLPADSVLQCCHGFCFNVQDTKFFRKAVRSVQYAAWFSCLHTVLPRNAVFVENRFRIRFILTIPLFGRQTVRFTGISLDKVGTFEPLFGLPGHEVWFAYSKNFHTMHEVIWNGAFECNQLKTNRCFLITYYYPIPKCNIPINQVVTSI